MLDWSRMNDVADTLLAVGAVLALLAGWARWLRPRWRRVMRDVKAARDSLLGREAVVDTITGKEISPALPGVGARMAHQEQQMDLLTMTVTKLVDQQQHQAALEARVGHVEGRVAALEEAAVERVVTRAESTAAWRAMEAAARNRDDNEDNEELE